MKKTIITAVSYQVKEKFRGINILCGCKTSEHMSSSWRHCSNTYGKLRNIPLAHFSTHSSKQFALCGWSEVDCKRDSMEDMMQGKKANELVNQEEAWVISVRSAHVVVTRSNLRVLGENRLD